MSIGDWDGGTELQFLGKRIGELEARCLVLMQEKRELEERIDKALHILRPYRDDPYHISWFAIDDALVALNPKEPI